MDLFRKLGIHEKNQGAYCGYEWQSPKRLSMLESINPATEDTIAKVSLCNLDDYHQLIERLHKASLEWRKIPAPKRGDIIRQIGESLRAHKSELGSLVSCEMGKSKQEGDGEVQEMIDMADFAVGQSRMLYGKMMHSERANHRMYEQWHPYGVIGVITAFNFPVAVWAWNAFLAAICGNVTLWKPSAKTPLCAIAVHKLCSEILRRNHCPDIFGLMIPESHDIAGAMVDDPRVSLVSFTGSTAVGKQIATRVVARLGRSLLELGGNNAIIVDESADLSLAIPSIVFGAIGTAGQRCTSTRRVLVHQSIYAAVMRELINAYQQITIGDPLNPRNLMGPLIDIRAVEAFKKAVANAKSAGGCVAFGGDVIQGRGYFVQATLITGLTNDCLLVQEETFAPILYVMPFSSLEEAISMQNGVPQGLSSSLFTQDLKKAELFLSTEGSDCGIANINIGTSGAEIGGAFGGEKETGGGRESGSDAWKAYMRRQTNTINWGNELPLAQGIMFNLR
jgi:aldehyde dehydrogenase (NAD+)